MATFENLRKRLEKYVDDNVSQEDAITLFDAASEDISLAARYGKVAEANFVKESPVIPFPVDWINLVELKIKRPIDKDFIRIAPIGLVQPEDFYTNSYLYGDMVAYEAFGDMIELRMAKPSDGKLLLRYYATLPEIKDINSSPKIPIHYHDLYPLHAAAKWFQNYQDELQTKNDYWSEFQTKLADLDLYTLQQKEKTKSKTVYVSRSWS